MVGFSTSSSSATLPVAIRVAERNLGVSSPVASTVLPLGATIGMDGAAMYVAMLTLFAAQAFGLDLRLADYFVIAGRSEEHTSELQSLMRISYAVFCLKKKKNTRYTKITQEHNHNQENHTRI